MNTILALRYNARYLCSTPEHLNPRVVPILADEHPSARRQFTALALQREIIMNDVGAHKGFPDSTRLQRPRRDVDIQRNRGNPLSRRSITTPAHPTVIRQSLAIQREVTMNDIRSYKRFHDPRPNVYPGRDAHLNEAGKPMSRGSNPTPVHPTIRRRSLRTACEVIM